MRQSLRGHRKEKEDPRRVPADLQLIIFEFLKVNQVLVVRRSTKKVPNRTQDAPHSIKSYQVPAPEDRPSTESTRHPAPRGPLPQTRPDLEEEVRLQIPEDQTEGALLM